MTISERQQYAKDNMGQAIRLEAKSKDMRVSRMQRKHAAILAYAIRLGYSNTIEANDAGYSEKLREIFNSTK